MDTLNHLDRTVADVLDVLKNRGFIDSTLIVFCGDNHHKQDLEESDRETHICRVSHCGYTGRAVRDRVGSAAAV
ncbi:MAG: hypothetical protein GXY83_30390 [Rhodopirellula sp.]|nr:hypothetical protein [Rhodopirellula sp.]